MLMTMDNSAPVVHGTGRPDTSPALGIALPTTNRQFRPLKIARVLEERCYVVHNDTLHISLQLSEPPPLGWSSIFNKCWLALEYPGDASNQPSAFTADYMKQSSKPAAGIEDNLLWIECPPDEMRTVHMPWLEKAIAQANDVYRASLQQKLASATAQRKMPEGKALADLRDLRQTLEGKHADTPAIPGKHTSYRTGVTMSVFCVFWIAFGAWPHKWSAAHPLAWSIGWVLGLLAAGTIAIASFWSALKPKS